MRASAAGSLPLKGLLIGGGQEGVGGAALRFMNGQASAIVSTENRGSADSLCCNGGRTALGRVTSTRMEGSADLLQSSPDLNAWTTLTTVTSSASGVCEQLVSVASRAFFRYAFQPPAP